MMEFADLMREDHLEKDDFEATFEWESVETHLNNFLHGRSRLETITLTITVGEDLGWSDEIMEFLHDELKL